MRTVLAVLFVLLFGVLAGCESLAPTAPETKQQPVLQNEAEDTCGTCGGNPPPSGGGGGG